MKIVYTRIDTSESAPENQGALIRDWDRAWRLAGYKTRILLCKERGTPYVNLSSRPPLK